MDGLGLNVRSLLLIDKIMLDQAPLHCVSETKNLQDCKAWKLSEQAQFLYRTGVREEDDNEGPVVTMRDMEMDMSDTGANQQHLDGGNERLLKYKWK